MPAHLNGSQIDRYLSRTLPPVELLALHDHLETCPECREMLAEVSMKDGAVIPSIEEAGDLHLLEAEMVEWVAKRTPESGRASIAAHLETCSLCRDSVAGMREAAVVAFPAKRSRAWFAGLAIAAAVALAVGLVYLRKPQAPELVASLQDGGGPISLHASGDLTGVSDASAEEQVWIRDALSQGTLPAGPAATRDSAGTLRTPDPSAPAEFALIAPVGIRVLDDRPVFSWQPDASSTDYEVVVTNEALEPVARSGKITATEWRPPAPLARGAVLFWQVRASRRGATVIVPAPPQPPARLEIASATAAQRIEQLRATPRYSHLLAAAICAHEGLISETAKELAALQQENPGSPIVQSLEKNR
jgi:hypothetical protein